MIKAIFSDLDCTLLSDDQSICQKNLEAISKARDKGVKFLFCTGRLPFCFKAYDYLGLNDSISANGSVIIKDNKIIKSDYIETNTKKRIIDYAIKKGLYIRIFALDFLYVLNHDKAPFTNIYKETKNVSDEEAREVANNINLCKISFCHEDHEFLKEVRKELESLNLDSTIEFSGEHHLECNVLGSSKGKGVLEFLKFNNIEVKEALGMGDNGNDLSMLKAVGVAACPINAIKDIKDICDYVSPYNNNEGAVADIIEKYVL